MKLLISLFIVISSFIIFADETKFEATNVTEFSLQKLRIENAKTWDLDMREWKRYETLMKGKRGKWTPNLDPLTVLGINATSASELKMYAEKLVHVERKRVDRELRFQKAYDEAQKRLYGNIPLYRIKPVSRQISGYSEGKNIKKIDYFLQIPCGDCGELVKRWVKNKIQLNLYFVKTNERVVKQWAKVNEIPMAYVSTGRITLNMGNGEAKERGITSFPYLVEYTKE